MEQETNSTVLSVSVCKVCREDIKPGALICNHCKSYQDWRSNLNISSTILTLLVALVSVSGVLVAVLKDALTPKDSSLVVSYQGSNAVVLNLLVSNAGTRPGAIQGAALIIPGHDAIGLELLGAQVNATLIGPGESRLLTLIRHGSSISAAPLTDCTAVIWSTRFSGKAEPIYSANIPCSDLSGFLKG